MSIDVFENIQKSNVVDDVDFILFMHCTEVVKNKVRNDLDLNDTHPRDEQVKECVNRLKKVFNIE